MCDTTRVRLQFCIKQSQKQSVFKRTVGSHSHEQAGWGGGEPAGQGSWLRLWSTWGRAADRWSPPSGSPQSCAAPATNTNTRTALSATTHSPLNNSTTQQERGGKFASWGWALPSSGGKGEVARCMNQFHTYKVLNEVVMSGGDAGGVDLPGGGGQFPPLWTAGRRCGIAWNSGRVCEGSGRGPRGWPCPAPRPRPPSAGRWSPRQSPAAQSRSPSPPCDPVGPQELGLPGCVYCFEHRGTIRHTHTHTSFRTRISSAAFRYCSWWVTRMRGLFFNRPQMHLRDTSTGWAGLIQIQAATTTRLGSSGQGGFRGPGLKKAVLGEGVGWS